jgi:hypothetical protein
LISVHLSDEELTSAAAGDRVPRTAHHVQICADCQQQIEMYRERMAKLREDVLYSAGRSAIDWGRQSRAIHQRIVAAHIQRINGRSTALVLAASALAMLLIFVLIGFRTGSPPLSVNRQPVTISDAALLTDVEAQLNEDLPEALQPAGLLVTEMGGIDRSAPSHNASHADMRNAQ